MSQTTVLLANELPKPKPPRLATTRNEDANEPLESVEMVEEYIEILELIEPI